MMWSVGHVIGHAAEAGCWYAITLAAAGVELHTYAVRVDPEALPGALLATLGASATLLAPSVDTAPAGARGWHAYGLADASGCAAMACDELLIHTDDAARAFGLAFDPDAELCLRTVERLFPDRPLDVEPWDALRWSNGRIALEGRPRPTPWRWYCAPHDEWPA